MSVTALAAKYDTVALMFPGQGSQFSGMGMDIARESASARTLIERADRVLGYPLSRVMAGEHGDELNRTVHTQPAVFVHSMALLELLRERCRFSTVVAAGHSLGEYSALCAGGALDFEEALDVVRTRAQAMDEAQPAGTCGMAALIGISKEDTCRIVDDCREDQILEAANFNAPDQVVVSGHLEAVQRVMEAVKGQKRTRAVMLPVSSAFHTSLMASARDTLSDRLESATLRTTAFPVLSNVTAQAYPSSVPEAKRLLMDQVVRPVLWEDCVKTMIQSGAEVFLEIGPGKVLTGLLRRIDRTVHTISISDLESMSSLDGTNS
ncbi:MAG: ACP S-malonyltransferase [Desulfomonile tiedjei]|nr:ACP S-malonyltransferase [Desulfomonile tiedjei]